MAYEHLALHPLGSAHSVLKVGQKSMILDQLVFTSTLLLSKVASHGMGTIKGTLWAIETITGHDAFNVLSGHWHMALTASFE